MKKKLNFFAKTQFFPETQSKFGQKLKIPRILANNLVKNYNSTCTFLRRACTNKAFSHVFVAHSGCSKVKTQEFLQNLIKLCKKTQF